MAGVCCIAKPEFIFHSSSSNGGGSNGGGSSNGGGGGGGGGDGGVGSSNLLTFNADGTAFTHFDAVLHGVANFDATSALAGTGGGALAIVPLTAAQHTLAVSIGLFGSVAAACAYVRSHSMCLCVSLCVSASLRVSLSLCESLCLYECVNV